MMLSEKDSRGLPDAERLADALATVMGHYEAMAGRLKSAEDRAADAERLAAHAENLEVLVEAPRDDLLELAARHSPLQ